jgi:AcrR family transcriptional regulator
LRSKKVGGATGLLSLHDVEGTYINMDEESTSARRAYHHGSLEETLIALGLEELEKTGDPDTLSVSALAKRASVSPMAPYRHFASKEAFLQALARRGFQLLGDQMREVDAPDPWEAVTAFGVCYVKFAIDNPGAFRLMFGRTPPTPDEGQAEDPSTVLGLVMSRLSQLVEAGRREDVFLTSWCLMHGLASLLVARRIRNIHDSPVNLARRVAGVLRQAIAAAG